MSLFIKPNIIFYIFKIKLADVINCQTVGYVT